MKKIRVTQWFRWNVKPVHIGYYQRGHGVDYLTVMPDYWDGKNWFICGSFGQSMGRAAANLSWRGVAK